MRSSSTWAGRCRGAGLAWVAGLLTTACTGLPGLPLGDGGDGGAPHAQLPPTEPGLAGQPRFTSANPDFSRSAHGLDAGSIAIDSGSQAMDAGALSSADASAAAPADPAAEDPARAIVEADIVQIVGDRLYALSEYRGLLIVDVGVRDQLRLLGRHRTQGTPFEMYLVDDVAYVIYRAFWTWAEDPVGGEASWQHTSRVAALDISEPAAIRPLGDFDLAGDISDSRLVGNILYAVSYEEAFCYLCTDRPRTVITSLAVGDVDNIHVVDRVAFESQGYSWGPRSISVTPQRIYVAGEQYSGSSSGSTLQVVDIGDLAGRLELGASVEVAGQIFSRWQMNEYQGVLRVISQPGGGGSSGNPVVQTYAVESSAQVRSLGSMTMVLPRPEQLMSVQFDGARAYAVTFERTDPLFLIDLSDPAQPEQRGELQMPGWLYHMAPMGDRLLALGYDQAWGALAVSLFDVADLDAPALLSRVAFGGDWATMAEDQDRIHKAFKILPELGLIAVPFAGWSASDGYRYHSGVQLIDLVDDELIARAVAPSQGQARRALLHDDRLLTLSDEKLQIFDIADRDAPLATASLTLARTVYVTADVDGTVAELVADWWTGEARLDLLPLSDPDGAALASVDLSSLRPGSEDTYAYWAYSFPYWDARLLVQGSTLWLAWSEYSPGDGGNRLRLVSVDVTDPTAPVVGAVHALDVDRGWSSWSAGEIVHGGDRVVLVGDALVVRTAETSYDCDWSCAGRGAGLAVIDLGDATAPRVIATLTPTPDGELGDLLVDGDTVLTAHRRVLADDPSRVALYLDRLDVADPQRPELQPAVNIPGALVGVEPATGQVVTLDLQVHAVPAPDWTACSALAAGLRFDYRHDSAQCLLYHQRLHLVDVVGDEAVVRERIAPAGTYLAQLAVLDARIVGLTSPWYRYGTVARPELLVYAPDPDGDWAQRASHDVGTTYLQLLATQGQRLMLAESFPPAVRVIDLADAAAPLLRSRRTLPGYAYRSRVVDGLLLTACGPWGVAVTPLDGSLPY